MDLTPGPFPKGKGSLLVEQRRLVAYMDGMQAGAEDGAFK